MSYTQEEYENAKHKALHNAAAASFANRVVVPEGAEKITLPLEGRDIQITYFKTECENAPLIIGYHGGGFIFGGCALEGDMWNAVKNALSANIAVIGYRKSPDFRRDATLADAWDSAIYLKEHFKDFGFDPGRICVMGQSAGGNLAACVALRDATEQKLGLKDQILIYPLLDMYTTPEEKGEVTNALLMRIMRDLHVDGEICKDPSVSPVFAEPQMLKGAAPAIIVTGGADSMRHEGIRYGEMLKAAGVPCSALTVPDMPHAFFETGLKARISKFEMEMLGPGGKELFEGGALRRACEQTLEFIKSEFVS